MKLPTLEELEDRGPAISTARALTVEEMQQAKTDKANKPDRLKTKRQSESLCKRQFQKFFNVKLVKVRDDLMTGPHGNYRVSKDVDFQGTMFLVTNGITQPRPLRVECKGITLKFNNVAKVRGSFALSRISDIQRGYLQTNRMMGGISVIYLSYHLEGQCDLSYIVSWRQWQRVEEELKERTQGNFHGKSLRYPTDMLLLETAQVYKHNSRWYLTDNHWIKQYLPTKNTQQLSLLDI